MKVNHKSIVILNSSPRKTIVKTIVRQYVGSLSKMGIFLIKDFHKIRNIILKVLRKVEKLKCVFK